MSPLDAAMLRLARVVLVLLKPSLAERARRVSEEPGEAEAGEELRVAEEVGRLAGMLAKAG